MAAVGTAPVFASSRDPISASPTETGCASMTLTQPAWRQPAQKTGAAATLLSAGSIRIGCVDGASVRLSRFPPQVLALTLPAITNRAP